MGESLVLRAGGLACALPVGVVEEVSRPHRVTVLSGVPPYVLGTARIRGVTTPLLDLGHVLTGKAGPEPARLVSLRVGSRRRVALAVESVQGVREFDAVEHRTVPPLLSQAASGLVQSIRELDEGLLAVLQGGCVLPDELWKQLEAVAEPTP